MSSFARWEREPVRLQEADKIECISRSGSTFFFFQAEDGIRDDLVTGSDVCSSDLSVVPRFAERHSRQVVQSAVVARVAGVDDRRALVTVAATVASRGVATRYLTVPVARDARDGDRKSVV